MILVLSKVIPALLFPVGFAILVCLAAAVLAWRARARAAGIAALVAAVVLYAAASPVVANRLMVALERHYPPLLENPRAAAIVLLGGGVAPLFAPRVYPETNAAGDRVIHAVRLWNQGLAPVIVPTGGTIGFMWETATTEAEVYAQLLVGTFGMPDSAVIPMSLSRVTHEDALFTAALFDSLGLEKEILLVTSASHMPRSAALFRKHGFLVHPAPTDFRGNLNSGFKLYELLPMAWALEQTTIALHEYLGMAAYKVMGRL